MEAYSLPPYHKVYHKKHQKQKITGSSEIASSLAGKRFIAPKGQGTLFMGRLVIQSNAGSLLF
jgi:hypothetical protein